MKGTLYSIEPELGFMASVAEYVLTSSGLKTEDLPGTLIFVPGSGAREALMEAFLQQSDGKATLLPRILTLGDIIGESEALPPPIGSLDPIDTITPLERQCRLASHIKTLGPKITGEALSAPQAWYMARSLGDLLDDFQMADVEADALRTLVPDDLAHHWQQSLDLLGLLFSTWPAERDSLGKTDMELARALILTRMADHFTTLMQDPGMTCPPLFIAGSTGSRPSVRCFIAALYKKAGATIFIPGLDTDMPEEVYTQLDPTHPQWLLHALLTQLDETPDAVKSITPSNPQPRLSLFREALAPANTTDSWHKTLYREIPADQLFEGLSLFEAPSRREEAAAIALALREAAETPNRTALLVTPDKALASQVQDHLSIWGLEVDDAGGQTLDTLPQGRFMQAVAEVLSGDFRPITLLALLLNPYTHLGRKRDTLRRLARLIDKTLLRGPRVSGGLKGLAAKAQQKLQGNDRTAVIDLLHDLDDLLGGTSPHPQPVRDHLQHHAYVAEKLAERDIGDDNSAPQTAFLEGQEGTSLSQFLSDLYGALPLKWQCMADEYPALFDQFQKGHSVRLARTRHHRIKIVGPLEIRNEQADLLILGGLNEESWPQSVEPDPWLNKAMRYQLGLSPQDQRTGQSAQDFLTGIAKENVLLTRSLKTDGSPTVMSRWLYRVEALAGHPIPRNNELSAFIVALDRWQRLKPVTKTAIAPPAPRPPVADRPNRLSVSDIQLWMRDPYALYAKRILKLRPLDPLDADPNAADKGTLLHAALEDFLKNPGPIKGDEGLARLISLGEQVFESFNDVPTVRAFWWPRFVTLAKAFIIHAEHWWDTHEKLVIEEEGSFTLPGTGFTVFARADRIDTTLGGDAVVIDYKTGQIPTGLQIVAGYAPQLPLEGLILQKGGFKGKSYSVSSLQYWLARGGKDPLKFSTAEKLAKREASQLIAEAEAGLMALVLKFSIEGTPYLSNPRPNVTGGGDYDHLARVKEWRDRIAFKEDETVDEAAP